MWFLAKYLILAVFLLEWADSSSGDNSIFYKNCVEICYLTNCGQSYSEEQPYNVLFIQFSCRDECKYSCMWTTIETFHERNWETPQFHGKWPFIRLFGLQEPASVLFSILNAYVHLKMIIKFRKKVRPQYPLAYLWYAFCLVCLHAWFWSAVFHARDLPLTELLDYACAFSMVLMSCYVMVVRLLRDLVPRFAFVAITAFFVAFFANHVAYLSSGRFDYGFNMELNILVGTITAICWFGWCIYNRGRQPYVWKCVTFVALMGIVTLLEVVDRPPFFFIFDFHSLWHLATAPLTILIYSFAIDDCLYLRKKDKRAMEIARKLP